MTSIRRYVHTLAPILLVTLLAAALPFFTACGEDSEDSGSPNADADPDPEADPEAGTPTVDPGPPDVTVSVVLKEWSVEPSRPTVKAGVVRFLADNSGKVIHELVVLKDGKELGEVEGLAPNHVESMSLRLEKGKYELACLIVEKVDGKTVDHYANGMKAAFVIE